LRAFKKPPTETGLANARGAPIDPVPEAS
jgi:hypothetical protein